MTKLDEALSHGPIREIFDDIFLVTGSNIVMHEGVELQHSRNMVVVREEGKLSLINTVRLTESGLAALEELGRVEQIIRIGSFHGRDDSFYVNRYNAKLWALNKMHDQNGCTTDVEYTSEGPSPFKNSSVIIFKAAKFPEAVIHINIHGGILITCDSVKNWVGPDEFFSESTAKMYQELSYFGKATISDVWLKAMGVQTNDFDELMDIKFRHLLSAHGVPLLDTAKEDLAISIEGLLANSTPKYRK